MSNERTHYTTTEAGAVLGMSRHQVKRIAIADCIAVVHTKPFLFRKEDVLALKKRIALVSQKLQFSGGKDVVKAIGAVKAAEFPRHWKLSKETAEWFTKHGVSCRGHS